ncbi:hypothetical protein HK105_208927 [Polyrhizophydium stewartii]|uniref:ATP-grasp domain-containing protein n=1 Tax=Polyrhizophydium stewartii TaxID=2732419 RepID=A0ABR4MWG4_9FUNG|nr:hypothetical protein HK105_008262 [Polyrhizophydium stewartii]
MSTTPFSATRPKDKDQLPPPQWRGDIDDLMRSSISLVQAATPLMDKARAKEPPVCYGRVKDLEAMVPAQWWKYVFADAMYLKTDGDVVEDPDVTQGEIALLEAVPEIKNLILRGSGAGANDDGSIEESPARILDLCCGQGRHSLHLVKEYPHLYVHGHDQSSYLISLAQERASFQSVTTQTFFTVGDCRQIPYPDATFDLVLLLGNSFGFFSDEDSDRAVLAEVARVLMPGGRLVLDLTDGEYMRNNFSERGWEWADDTTFVCRERQLSADRLRLISREIITVASKGVVRDQFYQERLYSRAELHGLMIEAGLLPDDQPSASANDGIITIGYDLSKRKEDLGMMEQRMMLMAVKPEAAKAGDQQDAPLACQAGLASPASVTASMDQPKQRQRSADPAAAAVGAAAHLIPTVDELVSQIGDSLVVTKDSPPPPFSSITVLLGDTSLGCVGKLNNTWNKEDFETRDKLLAALRDMGYGSDKIKVVDKHRGLAQQIAEGTSFVFNLCDEGFLNDALKEMHVPALLEIAGIPYSGAGPTCLALCYDKGLVNSTAGALGVPTPREMTYLGDTATPIVSDLERLDQLIQERIAYPAFIKPVKGDNSLGITGRSIVHDRAELCKYMDELAGLGIRDVLVQEYLSGTEYGVGMVGNPETGFHFFPILEVDYSKIVAKNLAPILGYESKWDPSSPYWTDIGYRRATMSPEAEKALKKICVVLWERFGCRDYARFDFRCDVGRGDGLDGLGGTIKLLEVNPNPGWCWDGKLAYMAKIEGIDYKGMLRMILQAAWDRTMRA